MGRISKIVSGVVLGGTKCPKLGCGPEDQGFDDIYDV